MRFVIQKHSKVGEKTHWDLMLEEAESLLTWRITALPDDSNKTINGIKIFDHDKKFLNYEGPVNKGLGQVKIEDSGEYEILKKQESCWTVKLVGKKIPGVFELNFTVE